MSLENILKELEQNSYDIDTIKDIDDSNLLIQIAEYSETKEYPLFTIECYKLAISISNEPTQASIYNRLARLYFIGLQDIAMSIKSSNSAIRIYKRLSDTNPLEYSQPLIEILNNLSTLQLQMNQSTNALDNALDAFDLALYLLPTNYSKYTTIFEQSTQNSIAIAKSLNETEDLKYIYAKSIEALREASEYDSSYMDKVEKYTKSLEKIEDRL
jgi:tetratricopeptide (TPR) repeat protein